jgi:hypothetical protein
LTARIGLTALTSGISFQRSLECSTVSAICVTGDASTARVVRTALRLHADRIRWAARIVQLHRVPL